VVDAEAKGLKEPGGQIVHVGSSVADPAFDVYMPDGQGVCGMHDGGGTPPCTRISNPAPAG